MSLFNLGQAIAQAATKKAVSTVRRRGESKDQQRSRAKGNYLPPDPSGLSQDARDTMAIQNNMMMPSRGFKRAGGDRPDFLGGGLDQFYANNPQIARGPARAGQLAQERQQQLNQGFEIAGQAAQAKLAEQQMQQQEQMANRGQNRSIDRGYGTGSVEFLPPGQRARGTMTDPVTGKQVFMDEYLPEQSRIQDTKYGAMPGQENGGALARPRVQSQPPQTQPQSPNLSGIDQIFPQQSSPPGGGNAGLVGAGVTQGAPGGDSLMTAQMPNTQGVGMMLPQAPLPNDTPGAYAAQSRARSFPQEKMTSYLPPGGEFMGPNRPNELGPAMPSFSPEQLEAFRVMDARGPAQSLGRPIAPSRLRFDFSNYFPGNDYEYLQRLFPGKSVEQILSLLESQNR